MPVSHPLLSRKPARTAPAIALLPPAQDILLNQTRVHEASGPARRTFAMWLAAQTDGPIIWVSPPWGQDPLHADGVAAWIDPARLVFVSPKRPEDLLWTMEEVLRSGAVALCVADLPNLPTLTHVRRMHLAAETGAQLAGPLPLGLLLTPGDGGAPGVETRWHLRAAHRGAEERWRLERLRARTAPRKRWDVTRAPGARSAAIKTA
ncbi:MAG: hypothetical protein AAF665_02200 [Pseudomonadota bacterium]